MDWWPPHMFAATFLVQAAVAAASALILLGVRLPMPGAAEMASGRPLAEIARQPRFVAAVVCGAVSYMLMNFLMTAAPWPCICADTRSNQPIWACNGTSSPCTRPASSRAASSCVSAPCAWPRRVGADGAVGGHRAGGRGRGALLVVADSAGAGLEFPVFWALPRWCWNATVPRRRHACNRSTTSLFSA